MKLFALFLALLVLGGCLLTGCSAPPHTTRILLLTQADLPPALLMTPILTNGSFQAWYSWPPLPTNGIWIIMTSTNLIDWIQADEWASLPDRAGRWAGTNHNGFPRRVDGPVEPGQIFFKVIKIK